MADPTPTPTSPFSVGATLKPGAGEQKITRAQAAALLADKLRAAGAVADDNATAAADKGGFAGFVQGAVQGVDATLGQIPNVTTGVARAAVDKVFGGGRPKDKYDALASKLVELLPEDALYESVVGQIDRRQIYAQVMTAGNVKQSKTVGGVKFGAEERALAGDLFGVEQDQAVTAATGLAAAAGITGDAEVKAYVSAAANAYHAQGTALGLSPTAPAAVQAVTPTEGTAAGGSDQSFADILAAGSTGAAGKTPFLTDADVQALFRLSSTDLAATNDYINSLASYRANVNADFTDPFKLRAGAGIAGVASTQPIPPTGTPGDNTGPYASAARSYSITEAKDLLYGMDKTEVAKMQNLLLRAGYFADANGKSTKPLFMGDATDQTTQRGWLNLIGDAIRAGQPMFDVLSKKALDAGDRFSMPDGTIAQDIVLTDSHAIAQGADDLGVKEIGRKLTDDEHAKVIEFIHGLESKAQTTSNEPGAQIVENPDIQAEINAYLQQTFPTEAGAKDVAGTYDEFTRMLAGPGGR